jgi:drug/metabolite transporter (DMT)-like permease
MTATLFLFAYAITFSYAYLILDIGTGALILFGAVQFTMILTAILSGNHLSIPEWAGVLIAFLGFIYLILPGITTPSAVGFLLMTTAGIAWGLYTLKGRGTENPLQATAYNFIRTIPFVILVLALQLRKLQTSPQGLVLAALSGGIASGLGYTIWYLALRNLSVTQAAVVQLSVPIIAAVGGLIFAREVITLRLILSAVLILGGILLVVLGKERGSQVAAKSVWRGI